MNFEITDDQAVIRSALSSLRRCWPVLLSGQHQLPIATAEGRVWDEAVTLIAHGSET
jgi:hypothetical protein